MRTDNPKNMRVSTVPDGTRRAHGPTMRALLLTVGLALFVPLGVACAEDDAPASGGVGGAGGATSQGGSGGSGLAAQISPTSDAACPVAPPESGDTCARADDSSTCVYDGTDCQRFDARCRGNVWTVLVVRETTCVARPCPTTAPEDGEACEESSIVGTNDCRFNQPKCGDSRRAICDGTKWTLAAAPDQPGCQIECPDAPPKVGSKCVGYAPGGCSYENGCEQKFIAQCSGGLWSPIQGRETCTTSECPAEQPVAGDSCIAFAPQLDCTYPGTCGVVRHARCNVETWVVNNPCAN